MPLFGDDTTHGVLEIWNLEEVGSALCNAKDGKATASAPAEVTGLAEGAFALLWGHRHCPNPTPLP